MTRIIPQLENNHRNDTPQWMNTEEIVQVGKKDLKVIDGLMKKTASENLVVASYSCISCNKVIMAGNKELRLQETLTKRASKQWIPACPHCGSILQIYKEVAPVERVSNLQSMSQEVKVNLKEGSYDVIGNDINYAQNEGECYFDEIRSDILAKVKHDEHGISVHRKPYSVSWSGRIFTGDTPDEVVDQVMNHITSEASQKIMKVKDVKASMNKKSDSQDSSREFDQILGDIMFRCDDSGIISGFEKTGEDEINKVIQLGLELDKTDIVNKFQTLVQAVNDATDGPWDEDSGYEDNLSDVGLSAFFELFNYSEMQEDDYQNSSDTDIDDFEDMDMQPLSSLNKKASGTYNTFIDRRMVYNAIEKLADYGRSNGMSMVVCRYLDSEHSKLAGNQVSTLNNIKCQLEWTYGRNQKARVTASIKVDEAGKFEFPKVFKVASGMEYPFEEKFVRMLEKESKLFQQLPNPKHTDVPTFRKSDPTRYRVASMNVLKVKDVKAGMNEEEQYLKELNRLLSQEIIDGDLNLRSAPITNLGNVERVNGSLDLRNTSIQSLGNLTHVGESLNLYNTPITSLNNLKYVGKSLYLQNTPISKSMTEEEIRSKIEIKENVYL